MLYYRVRRDAYDYFNKFAVVEGELLTEKERNRKARYISDNVFQEVHISKNKTYFSFGCRFIMSEYRKEIQ